jgi:hypothetical protein
MLRFCYQILPFVIVFCASFPSFSQAGWISCDNRKIWVDDTSGLEQGGYRAHYAANNYFVLMDQASKNVLTCQPIGPGCQILGFRSFPDDKESAKEITVVELRNGGLYRFFEIPSGKEIFLSEDPGQNLKIDSQPPQDSPGKPIAIVQSWTGDTSLIYQPEYILVGDTFAWRPLWERHAGKGVTCPQVDFSFNMVVGIFLGEVINTGGVLVTSVREDSDAISVDFVRQLIRPRGTQLYTQPYGIIVIPRSQKKIIIRENMQPVLGGGPLRWEIRAELQRD